MPHEVPAGSSDLLEKATVRDVEACGGRGREYFADGRRLGSLKEVT